MDNLKYSIENNIVCNKCVEELTIESKISANHRELWNEYKKNIKWYYQELQIKKIQKKH